GGRITVESVVRCSWNGWPDDREIRRAGVGAGRQRHKPAWHRETPCSSSARPVARISQSHAPGN
ncbi:hypothetical protein BH609_01700, partial [Pseudomonas aeruginosa]